MEIVGNLYVKYAEINKLSMVIAAPSVKGFQNVGCIFIMQVASIILSSHTDF